MSVGAWEHGRMWFVDVPVTDDTSPDDLDRLAGERPTSERTWYPAPLTWETKSPGGLIRDEVRCYCHVSIEAHNAERARRPCVQCQHPANGHQDGPGIGCTRPGCLCLCTPALAVSLPPTRPPTRG